MIPRSRGENSQVAALLHVGRMNGIHVVIVMARLTGGALLKGGDVVVGRWCCYRKLRDYL
jgi:hypothetical protein